jgi:FkbM family methyltransferase
LIDEIIRPQQSNCCAREHRSRSRYHYALCSALELQARPNVSSTLKKWVDRGASRLGLRVIPEWRVSSLPHARDVAHLFSQLRIDTVLDVGANAGGFRHFLRDHVGYAGRIVSFEPVRAVYEALVADAAHDPLWRGMQVALGDSDGELLINVCHKTTMSSFLRRDTARLAGLGYEHLLDVTDVDRTEPVPVRRLDMILGDVLEGRQDARIFLKCDTQGFDLKVIAGAAASMRSVMAVQVELALKPIYEGAPRYDQVLARMTADGFDVAGIYPVRQDELLRIVNFDCLMINSRHPAIVDMEGSQVVGRAPSFA